MENFSLTGSKGVPPSFTIYIPSEKKGVYILSAFRQKRKMKLQILAWGITLHKGTQFSLAWAPSLFNKHAKNRSTYIGMSGLRFI